ncbi:hypothetical protein DAPPUDRAFT_268332 [Daphnia pulex]|uniref:Uncharacterized protein n=1 Tax=Daphnia pulex TaxID=6669 RepID=E9HXN4_DAPPU|nr:hypothetical protein DAPPUDRAFT_268332 [Daphnia pulex]|eukprot:EFX63497.1 hypothetical protein DAPPUDRAFT_268332 [Daphnia pulex]
MASSNSHSVTQDGSHSISHLEFDEVMPSLNLGSSSQSFRWGRLRFSWKNWRINPHITPRINLLLHARHLGNRPRKPSLLSRIFHERMRILQNQMNSFIQHYGSFVKTFHPKINPTL